MAIAVHSRNLWVARSTMRVFRVLGATISASVFLALAAGAYAKHQNQIGAPSQQAQSSTDPAKFAFDVASVKEWQPGHRPSGPISPSLTRTPGRIFANCTSLQVLVFYAYRLTYAVPLSGLPAWASAPCGGDGNGVFIFEAKMPPETTEEQSREMMRNLLAERFKFAAHWESKNAPVLALVVRPGGFKLKPQATETQEEAKTQDKIGCPQNDPGCRFMRFSGTISDLAGMLATDFGRPVIDNTDIEGNYNFTLMWAGDSSENSSLPSLSTALKQLGLDLKSQTAPVKCLVVDHVEKPSGN